MTDPIALIVKYSCVCGLEKVACAVPLREKDEDIFSWMDRVTLLLTQDHRARSPQCHAESLKKVLIPIGNGDKKSARIGDAIPL